MAKTQKLLTVIHADGRPNTVTVAEDTLETLQAAVGGFIEPVPYFNKFDGRRASAVYCNEEGKCNGLPLNQSATKAWWACRQTSDFLVGDIIVVQTVPAGGR